MTAQLHAHLGSGEMTFDEVEMTVCIALAGVEVHIDCTNDGQILRLAEAAEGLAKDLREELAQRQIDRGDG